MANTPKRLQVLGKLGGGADIDVTAVPGQLIRVKEVDENVKPTAWEPVPWGYVESVMAEIVPETKTSSASNEMFELYWMLSQVHAKLEVGKTYTIMYNGIPYECVCQAAPAGITNNPNAVAMGNFSVVGGANTGEPFAMIYENSTVSIVDLTGTTVNPVVGIYGEEETIHTIPGKLLPEGVPYVEQGGMVELPVVGEWDGHDMMNITAPLGLEAGKTYTVIWDGTEYVDTAKEVVVEGLSAVAVGNTNDEEGGFPFVIAEFPADIAAEVGVNGGVLPGSGYGETAFSIYHNAETIHKIDPQCLPEGTPYVEDIYMADITVPLVWEDDDDDGVSDVGYSVTPFGFVIGENYIVKWNGIEYSCVAVDASVMFPGCILIGNDGLLTNVDNGIPFIAVDIPVEIAGSMDGNRAIVLPMTDVVDESITIYGNSETIHKIDPRCLPAGLPYIENYGSIEQILAETTFIDLSKEPKQIIEIPLAYGKTYIVNWNGVEYTCIAEIAGDGNYIYIGNGGYFFGTDNNEPFGILYVNNIITGESGTMLCSQDGSTTATVSIKCSDEVIHKMDKRLIPEDVGVVYILSKSDGEIKLTGSDGSETSVAASDLPSVTTANNGAFLRVVNGSWATLKLPNAEEATF